jgi:hypothetical protein
MFSTVQPWLQLRGPGAGRASGPMHDRLSLSATVPRCLWLVTEPCEWPTMAQEVLTRFRAVSHLDIAGNGIFDARQELR